MNESTTAKHDLGFSAPILPVDPTPLNDAAAIINVTKQKIYLDLQAKLGNVEQLVGIAHAQIYLSLARELNKIARVIDRVKGQITMDLTSKAGEISAQAMIAGAAPPHFLAHPDTPPPQHHLWYIVRDRKGHHKVISVPQGKVVKVGDHV